MLRTLMLAGAALAAAGCAHAQPAQDATTTILQRYATDFASDPYLDREMTFGVQVGERWWSVHATPGADRAPGHVVVSEGRPTTPSFYFKVDSPETLARVDRGELNALTAMAKARSSDASPMDFDLMEGFQPSDPNFVPWLIPMVFHFWTRGTPEVIPFNSEVTRVVHGANMGVFFYQQGFRSAFFEIRPGQHVNENPRDQSNPFPSLFVLMHGRVNARLGGHDMVLSEGQAVLIPPGMTHEFTNSFSEPGRGILLMFGEGA